MVIPRDALCRICRRIGQKAGEAHCFGRTTWARQYRPRRHPAPRTETKDSNQGQEPTLRLSLFTDYSIRLLMYLAAAPASRLVRTREVAAAYGISAHHLQKIVRGLVETGYVDALPGRNGGLRLARAASDIRIGTLVAASEGIGQLVDCGRGPCPLAGRCLLKGVLDDAERLFIAELDKRTLADVVASPTGTTLRRMMSAARPTATA